MTEQAVLAMAYGTPSGLDDVEAYYTHIRGGRPPHPELLAELVERYEAIGGRSPLREISEAQARGIERRLEGARVYLGMKHSSPFIADAVARMASDGVERAVGLVLAPHYSSMSVGDYARRAAEAADDAGWRGKLEMIESWHLEPGFVQWLADAVHEALRSLPELTRGGAGVAFTAHSLPARILDMHDPYPQQLRETAGAVARAAGLRRFTVAWQSAGRTREPWLGPDILQVIEEEAQAGAPGVVVCPCGFIADHLEVLFDLDIECQRRAAGLGIAFARTRSPNDDPVFLDALAGIVRRALGGLA